MKFLTKPDLVRIAESLVVAVVLVICYMIGGRPGAVLCAGMLTLFSVYKVVSDPY